LLILNAVRCGLFAEMIPGPSVKSSFTMDHWVLIDWAGGWVQYSELYSVSFSWLIPFLNQKSSICCSLQYPQCFRSGWI
jgi:hypothetical protein